MTREPPPAITIKLVSDQHQAMDDPAARADIRGVVAHYAGPLLCNLGTRID